MAGRRILEAGRRITPMKTSIAIILFGSALSALAAEHAGQTLEDRARPYLASALAAGNAFVSVSSASGMPNLAPDSLATALGSNLAEQTATGAAPYPTNLGGIGLQVVDSSGASRVAQLLYVSPTQINYIVPPGTAPGTATLNIVNGTGNVPSSTAQIQTIAPGLFTADGSGQGVVAATAYRTIAPSTLATPVQVYQCSGGAPPVCTSVPINLGVDTPVSVTFYATGLRGRSSDSAVTVTIGGQSIPVRSISSQDDSSALAGVDEVTVGLTLSLRNAGEVDVVLAVDGASSNTARINIQ
jgi:uncharacterized protein (TIGR03437 family)